MFDAIAAPPLHRADDRRRVELTGEVNEVADEFASLTRVEGRMGQGQFALDPTRSGADGSQRQPWS